MMVLAGSVAYWWNTCLAYMRPELWLKEGRGEGQKLALPSEGSKAVTIGWFLSELWAMEMTQQGKHTDLHTKDCMVVLPYKPSTDRRRQMISLELTGSQPRLLGELQASKRLCSKKNKKQHKWPPYMSKGTHTNLYSHEHRHLCACAHTQATKKRVGCQTK